MSEILFPGHLIQVGEVLSPLEPEQIRFLHRLHGNPQVVEIGSRVTLGEWLRGLHLGQGADFWDGFFATLEGGGV